MDLLSGSPPEFYFPQRSCLLACVPGLAQVVIPQDDLGKYQTPEKKWRMGFRKQPEFVAAFDKRILTKTEQCENIWYYCKMSNL